MPAKLFRLHFQIVHIPKLQITKKFLFSSSWWGAVEIEHSRKRVPHIRKCWEPQTHIKVKENFNQLVLLCQFSIIPENFYVPSEPRNPSRQYSSGLTCVACLMALILRWRNPRKKWTAGLANPDSPVLEILAFSSHAYNTSSAPIPCSTRSKCPKEEKTMIFLGEFISRT